MKRLFCAVCCLSLASIPALAQHHHATTASAKAPMTDQQFVDFAAQTDMVEANLGQLAQSVAKSQAVQGYGKMLDTDHTNDYKQLQRAAKDADLILHVAQGARRQGNPRLAQKKQKSLPASDLLALDRDIAARRTRYADVARLWLWAGVLTGLRPGEWRETALSADGLTLIVRNAKHSNGRANGSHRHLHLDAMSPDERAAIARMVDLSAATDNFTRLYHRVRKIVRESAKRCWPQRLRRPSLYSARHQWAANAKRVYSKRVVAALAGHASEATAGIHYARRQKGEPANLPQAEPQDLERVRRADPAHPFPGSKPAARDRHAD